MRVAAIYDIHGNLPALEAVLEEIHDEGVDRIIVGGDIVPGPMPNECVQALLDLPIPVDFIFGNGETDTLALHRGKGLVRIPAQFHEVMRWVGNHLPPEHFVEFAKWPAMVSLDIPGVGEVLFCHATPRDDNEIFTRVTPEDTLRPIFEATGAGVVICGHTHMQFDRTVGSVRVVNAGSVGMPFGEPGAYWVMLGPTLELRRTHYDLVAADARIRATDYPQVAGLDVLHPPREAEMERLFEDAALSPGR
ncbi:MAG: metallophosphoesterase family protein [Gemmatimonadetes bacterium]|nr:metallophosphoesterase family protein [Gemmatimonadota bacterium]